MAVEAKVVIVPKVKGPLEIHAVVLPDPGPHQVLIKQFASGICHSQLHTMHRSRSAPEVLGHESTGQVLEVGSEVSHVAPGDTVMVTWVPRSIVAGDRIPQAARVELANGDVATCSNVFTWADHTLADEGYVVKVPSTIEPLVSSIIGCAVMTGAGAVENTANVQAGDSVAIFGVGGVGLSAVVAARARGADPLIAVDLDDEKLAFARRFGATHTINAAKADPITEIRGLTQKTGRATIRRETVAGADFVFDCIGIKKTMEQIVPAARTGFFGAESGGTAVLVGVPTTGVELDPVDLLMNEKRFIGSIGGSCSPDRDFPRYIQWHQEGTLDLESLVTERFRLEDINTATAALESGKIQGRAILVF
jgi:Zn-dependent alcohol dehydrogenase